jgi:hypothetical protein
MPNTRAQGYGGSPTEEQHQVNQLEPLVTTQSINRLESVLADFGTILDTITSRLDTIEASSSSQGSGSLPKQSTMQDQGHTSGYGQSVLTQPLSTPPMLGRFNDDDRVGLHPVEFLNSMEVYLKQTHVPVSDWIHFAISHMDGMPGDWGQVFEETWGSWESFKAAFLDLFWSENKQDSLVDELHKSIYNRQQHNSMAEFFVLWMKRIKYLSTPIPPRSFVRRMSHLFPSNVENVLVAARVSTLAEMLSILRDMDDAAARRQQRGGDGHVVGPRSQHHRNDGGTQNYHGTRSNAFPQQQWRDVNGQNKQWRDRSGNNENRPRIHQLEMNPDAAGEESSQEAWREATTIGNDQHQPGNE